MTVEEKPVQETGLLGLAQRLVSVLQEVAEKQPVMLLATALACVALLLGLGAYMIGVGGPDLVKQMASSFTEGSQQVSEGLTDLRNDLRKAAADFTKQIEELNERLSALEKKIPGLTPPG